MLPEIVFSALEKAIEVRSQVPEIIIAPHSSNTIFLSFFSTLATSFQNNFIFK